MRTFDSVTVSYSGTAVFTYETLHIWRAVSQLPVPEGGSKEESRGFEAPYETSSITSCPHPHTTGPYLPSAGLLVLVVVAPSAQHIGKLVVVVLVAAWGSSNHRRRP